MIRHSAFRRSFPMIGMRTTALLALVAFLIAACTSQTKPAAVSPFPPGAARTLQQFNGAHVAMPIGLFLASLDMDRDLLVSGDEARNGALASFHAGDMDGDDLLSPIEFEDWSLKHLGARQTTPGRLQLDRNQDLRISPQEFTLAFGAMHEHLDLDKDGHLARAELLSQINGSVGDAQAIRAQVEAEMRREMPGKIREICQRGRRT